MQRDKGAMAQVYEGAKVQGVQVRGVRLHRMPGNKGARNARGAKVQGCKGHKGARAQGYKVQGV